MYLDCLSEKQPARIVFKGRTHFANTWKSVCLEILEGVFSSEDAKGIKIKNKELSSTKKPICTDKQVGPYDFSMLNGLFFSAGLSEKEYAFSCYDICKLYAITPFELNIEYTGDHRLVVNVQQKDKTVQADNENTQKFELPDEDFEEISVNIDEEPVPQKETVAADETENKKEAEKEDSTAEEASNTSAKKIRFYYNNAQYSDKLKGSSEFSKTTRNLVKVLAKKAPEFLEKLCYCDCSFVDDNQKVEAAATFVIVNGSESLVSGAVIDLNRIDAVCVRKNQMACLPFFGINGIRVFDESGEEIL